jgi:hypothetical protein
MGGRFRAQQAPNWGIGRRSEMYYKQIQQLIKKFHGIYADTT